MALATPRILPCHLHAFAPDLHPATSTVCILGTITSMHGDQATLESYDNQSVTIILSRDSHLSLLAMYEVVGKVINLEGGQGLGIRVLGTTEWPRDANGQLPDLKAYAAVVDATHRYKSMFYEGDGSGAGDDGGY